MREEKEKKREQALLTLLESYEASRKQPKQPRTFGKRNGSGGGSDTARGTDDAVTSGMTGELNSLRVQVRHAHAPMMPRSVS